MARLVSIAGAAGAFALCAALACDDGGFDPLSWDRALLGLAAASLVLVLLAGGERPGRHGALLLGALGLLTAWTAASWLWSESPPRALVEAQRVALYLAAATAVVLVGRCLSWPAVAAGVVAASVLVAAWNLVARSEGVAHPRDSGALDAPVGYANGIALLCVLGLVLLPALPRLAWLAAPPLAVDLWLQGSGGAGVALAAAVLCYAALSRPRLRVAVVVVGLAGTAALPFALRGHDRGQYWRAATAEAQAHPVLGSGAGTYVNWWLRERTVPISTREAHSLYFETVAEVGPLGLALLLVVLAVPLVAATRLRAPALAAALVAYDVAAAVDFHWELAGVTVPFVLLAAGACVHASPATRPRRSAIAAPALALLTAAAVLAYAGTSRLDAAQAALRRGDAGGAAASARSALVFAPYSADAWGVIGDAERSAAAYRRALALDPNDWSLWRRLAVVTDGRPRRRAESEATRLNPLFSGS